MKSFESNYVVIVIITVLCEMLLPYVILVQNCNLLVTCRLSRLVFFGYSCVSNLLVNRVFKGNCPGNLGHIVAALGNVW